MKTVVLLWMMLLLAACNLAPTPNNPTPTPETDPTSIPETPPDVPTVGAPDLEPSGAGPCVATPAGSENVPLHDAADSNAPVIAMLGAGLGEVPFEFDNGFYAISWFEGSQEIIGWLSESLIQLEGECEF